MMDVFIGSFIFGALSAVFAIVVIIRQRPDFIQKVIDKISKKDQCAGGNCTK